MNTLWKIVKTLSIACMMQLALFVCVTSSMNAAAASTAPAWEQETPLGNGVYLSAYAQIGDTLYVFGGRQNSSLPDLNVAYTYDLLTGQQTRLPDLPLGVSGASAVLGNDGLIYIIGGRNSSFFPTTLGRVQIFDPSTNTYTRGADMLVGMTIFPLVKVPSGKFVAMGGYNSSALTALSDTQIYDPTTDKWSAAADLPVARYSASAVLLNERIYYFGGSDTMVQFDDVYVYDYRYDYWNGEPIGLQSPLAATASILASDGMVYLTGGGTFGTSLSGGVNQSSYLSLSAMGFMSLPNMGTPRKYHMIAESSQGRLFVFGGIMDYGSYYSTTASVESISIGSAKVSLSSDNLVSGDKVNVKLDLDYAFATYDEVYADIALRGSDGTTYDLGDHGGRLTTTSLSMEVAIPENLETGTYTLVVQIPYAYRDGAYVSDTFPELTLTTNITSGESLRERLEDLAQQNEALQDSLNQSNQRIDELTDKVNGKLDSTVGILILVLVIVILVMVALQLMMRFRRRA